MKLKVIAGIVLTLFLIDMLTLAFNIQPVKAGKIYTHLYIRADGRVEPSTAPISSVDNVTYTFTDNIYCGDVPGNVIIVQRDNIVIDGAGYTLDGSGPWWPWGRTMAGIVLNARHNVTIKNIEIKGFEEAGIRLYSSSNNTILENKITVNSEFGIDLAVSSNNVITGNTITQNGHGIFLGGSSNVISGNNIVNNSYGIDLVESSNSVVSENNITKNNGGIVVRHLSSENNISGNNITVNSRYAIRIDDSSINIISGNTIIKNDLGIQLVGSSSNTISGNNITNNNGGIKLDSSSNNTIYGNNITANSGYGIFVVGSSSNDVSENNMTNNEKGIELDSSSHNMVSRNDITNNINGIFLIASSSNVISGNNITNNDNGIGFSAFDYGPYDNLIYHNNFVDNTKQVDSYNSINFWDNGYPSGGNYWSDYTGKDGNGDGIGDTPYVIDENNQDNYPLMNPWGSKITVKVPFWMQWWFWIIVSAGIVVLVGAIYFLMKRK